MLDWRKQGATVESIEHEYLANTLVPIPPIAETDSIVTKLRILDLQYDALQEETLVSINLLKERRSALISAAVTGKIDVRDRQPQESASDEDYLQAAEEPARYA